MTDVCQVTEILYYIVKYFSLTIAFKNYIDMTVNGADSEGLVCMCIVDYSE